MCFEFYVVQAHKTTLRLRNDCGTPYSHRGHAFLTFRSLFALAVLLQIILQHCDISFPHLLGIFSRSRITSIVLIGIEINKESLIA